MSHPEPYQETWLPNGIRSRYLSNGNGLMMHFLETGYESGKRHTVILLHGFPELAYCWRAIMIPLAESGYHVIAPDQRGYGRTIGGDCSYDCNLSSFHPHNLAQDIRGLANALGCVRISVVGHDFGSPVAAFCALKYPDFVSAVALMSAPFSGLNSSSQDSDSREQIATQLARLPRPRKHYQDYYCSREANENMCRPPQGLGQFQRAYYHFKSADWKGNVPLPLQSSSADELSRMPEYYIMDLDQGMAETVDAHRPSESEIESNQWMPKQALNVFTHEYERTGYQGGLNWYRAISQASPLADAALSKVINQPSIFISGASDWGSYQKPGAMDRMRLEACSRMESVHLIDGGGPLGPARESGSNIALDCRFPESQRSRIAP